MKNDFVSLSQPWLSGLFILAIWLTVLCSNYFHSTNNELNHLPLHWVQYCGCSWTLSPPSQTYQTSSFLFVAHHRLVNRMLNLLSSLPRTDKPSWLKNNVKLRPKAFKFTRNCDKKRNQSRFWFCIGWNLIFKSWFRHLKEKQYWLLAFKICIADQNLRSWKHYLILKLVIVVFDVHYESLNSN